MENENQNDTRTAESVQNADQGNKPETVKAQYTEIKRTFEKSADGEQAVTTVKSVAAEASASTNEIKSFEVKEARFVKETSFAEEGEKSAESSFVKRANEQLEASREDMNRGPNGEDRGGQNRQNRQGEYGRGPVRRNRDNRDNYQGKKNRNNDNRGNGGNGQNQPGGQQGGNQGGNQPKNNDGRNQNRDNRGGREGRQENSQDNQSVRERFNKNERYGRNSRDGQDGGFRRRGAKNETAEDIKKDIESIEKEIELEIADISVMRLGM